MKDSKSVKERKRAKKQPKKNNKVLEERLKRITRER
jgi:hypothetical protein